MVAHILQWNQCLRKALFNKSSYGEQIGSGLAHTYGNLSQVIAVNNILYEEPLSFGQRRLILRKMGSHLPPESTALEPVDQFLHYSQHVDQRLSEFIYEVAKVGSLAVYKHGITNRTLTAIQSSPIENNYFTEYLHLVGYKTAQESQVLKQLKHNLDTLRPAVNEAHHHSIERLKDLQTLSHMVGDIQRRIEDDRVRFAKDQLDAMGEHHLLIRILEKIFGHQASSQVVQINDSLSLADSLFRWTKQMESWLHLLISYLWNVKVCLDDLSRTVCDQDRTIRWSSTEQAKHEALGEFITMVNEGVAVLEFNMLAWRRQLLLAAGNTSGE